MRPMRALGLLAVVAALALLGAGHSSAWRSSDHLETSASRIVSGLDAQASRGPDLTVGPGDSLIGVWSDQFSIKFGRSFGGQHPDYHDWMVSTINGTAVPTGTDEDTSWPVVRTYGSTNFGSRVAVAYLFNFPKAGGGHQHDVVLATGTLTSVAPGVAWSDLTRVTFSEFDDAKRVSVAFDSAGKIHLAWEDDPANSPFNVVRYQRWEPRADPVVISVPGRHAIRPVLAAETGRMHIAYIEAGRAIERFFEAGAPDVWSDPTLSAGTSVGELDLAILPSGEGGFGTPIVVYDDFTCGQSRAIYAVAPGIGPTQLSNCAAGDQTDPVVTIRASERTVHAVWHKPMSLARWGPLFNARMEANVGWRWWTPQEVPSFLGDVTNGWFEQEIVATANGEQVLARGSTSKAASGQEIQHVSNPHPGQDAQNVRAEPIPGGGGIRLTWDAFPPGGAEGLANSEYHSIRILRKPADDFRGPYDPNATVVATYHTGVTLVGHSYHTTTPLPTTHDDATADPAQSYVYKLFVGNRGPRQASNFSESPGYRDGTSVAYGSPPSVTAPPLPPPPTFGVGRKVTNLQATASETRVDLSWTPPVEYERIKVVRKADAPPASVTDGTLVFDAKGTSLADTGLTNATTYYYAVYTVYDGGKLSQSVVINATPDVPGAPFTYTTQPTGNYAGTADFYTLGGVFHVTEDKVVLKFGRVYKPGSTSGNKIGIWDDATGQLLASATISPNSPNAYLATPLALQANRRYVIGIKEEAGTPWSSERKLIGLPPWLVIDDVAFSRSGVFNFPELRGNKPGWSNEDWRITFGSPDSEPIHQSEPVTELVAVGGHARVDLSWTNPAVFDRVKIVRKIGSPPTSLADGTIVYIGQDDMFADTELANGTTYHYAVYTDLGRESSPPVRTSATPSLPAGALTYSAQPTGAYDNVVATYNSGVSFHVTTDKNLLEVGRVYKPGSSTGNQIGIWQESTQTLLASTSVTPAGPRAVLTTPVLLKANERYVLGIVESSGSPWSSSRPLVGLPSFLVIDDAAFNRNSTLSYPDLRSGKPGESNEDWIMTFGDPGGLPVSNLRAVPSDRRVDLSWTSPSDGGRVVVVRKAGAEPVDPTDGTVLFDGVGNATTDTGLTNGTTYHYSVWVRRAALLSAPARTSAIPAATALAPVAAFQARSGDESVSLSWTAGGPDSLAVLGDSLSTGASLEQLDVTARSRTWATGDNATDGVDSHYERLLRFNPAIAGKNANFAVDGAPMSSLYNQAGSAVAAGAAYVAVLAGLNDVCVGQGATMTSVSDYRSQTRSMIARLNAGLPNASIFVASIPDPVRIWTVLKDNAAAPSAWQSRLRCPNVLGTLVTDADRALVRQRVIELNQVLADECAAASRCRFDLNAVFNTPFVAADYSTADYFHFSAAGQARLASVTWAASFWPDLASTRTKVVRKAGAAPADPTDGVLVHDGTGIAATDSGLTNGTIYHYAAWVEQSGRLSTVGRATATPSEYTTYVSRPTGDFGNTADSYNIGFVFHVTVDKSLLGLGRIYKPGSTGANQIGIWNETTRAQLASATVSPGAPSVALSAPVVLTAGTRYVLGIKESAGSPWSNARALTGLPSFLVIDDGAYNRNTTFSYPDLRNNQSPPISLADDWTMTFGRPNAGAITLVDPVTALAAAPGDTKVDLSWTKPTTPFTQIKVIRKAGSQPVTPADGTLVYEGTSSSATDTGLVNGTLYHYGVWVERGSDVSTAARKSVTPTGILPDPVRALEALAGDGRVDLSWTNPTSPLDQIKIVRKEDVPPTNPSDGTVVYTGTGTSASDTGLANGTAYYYSVWVQRGAELSSAMRASATPGTAPLNPVTGLLATAGDGRVDISWSNPSTPFDSVKVVRKAGSAPEHPNDGATVLAGTANSVADQNLVNGTTYHYAVWVIRGSDLSPPTAATATPSIPSVGDFKAIAGDRRVDLSWTNPPVTFDSIEVVRSTAGPPATPGAGTLLFSGNSTAAIDAGLTNGTLYYYAVWVKRAGQISLAARATALPVDPLDTVTYTAQPTGTYAGTATDYVLGAVFHVTTDKALVKVGRVYKAGSTGQNQIGIWDETTRTLLASVTVGPAAPVATLPSALVLQADKRYVLGIKASAGSPWSGGRVLTGMPGFLVIDDAAYNRKTTFSYPDLRNNQPGRSNEDWTMTFGEVVSVPDAPGSVTGLAAVPGDGKIDLSWANPTTPFDAIQIVRKAGAAPADPTDGTTIYSGTGTAVSDAGLANGTTYHYGVWVVEGSQLSIPARLSATPEFPAPAPVTNLMARPGDGLVDLSWTNPAGLFDRIKVVRKVGVAPANPTDGTIVYSGTASSVTDRSLTNGSEYFYGVWVERGSKVSAATRLTATPAAPSLDAVTALTATPDDLSVALAWKNPTTPYDLIKVVRKAGTAPVDPSDGVLVYSGTGESVLDAGLTNATTYHYAVWVQRSGENSQAARVTAIPAAPPLTGVTSLEAQSGNFRVDLSWTNPAFRFDRVLVVRKAGADPTSPADGITVHNGSGSAASDMGLVNGTTYHYAVWVERDGQLSPATRATATPIDRTSEVVYATTPNNYAGAAASYNLGAFFHLTEDRVLLRLGRVYKPGSTAGNRIGIWDPSTQSLLASVDVTPANPTATLAIPLQLVAGRSYVIGVKAATGSAWSSGRLVTGLPDFLVIDDSAFNRNSTFSYPDLRNNVPGMANDDWTMTFAGVGAQPPPDPVSSFEAAAGDARVDLSWSNPSTPFEVVKLVRKAGAAPADPSDGTLVYSGTATSFADVGLTNGTTYHYGIWVERSSILSTATRTSATPQFSSPNPVTNLARAPGDERVSLSWTNPTTAFDLIRVVRKATSAPVDPSDGTLVYSGVGTSTTDAGLTNGVEYHYAVWSNRGGSLSTPTRTSAVPTPVTRYSSQPLGDYAQSLASYNIGFVFHLTESKSVLKLGRAYKPGSTAGNRIGIWEDGTGALLASVDVSPAAPNATLATPLVLAAGKSYVLGISEVAGTPWSNVRPLTGLPSFLVVDDSAYNREPAFSYPNLRNNQSAPIAVAEDWTMTFGRPDSGPLVPPDPVTNLEATAGDREVDLTWSNPTTSFDRVKVVRKAGAAPADPADGVLLASGATTSVVNDMGLTNGVLYHYAVWTERFGELSTPLRTTAIPTNGIPDPIRDLQATPGNTRIDLTWTNPASSFDGIMVVRKAGTAPGNPADGTLVFDGVGVAAADGGLVNGTTYHYAVWVQRGDEISTATRTSAVAGSPPPEPVTNLVATPGDRQVGLSWNAPSSFATIKVVRKAGAAPGDPTDGTVIYDGTGTMLVDAGLVNGTVYHYAVWVERDGAFSTPVRATAAPVPAPVPPVTNVRSTSGDGRVDLAWVNPAETFDRIVVVRKPGGEPIDPADGTTVLDGSGTSLADVGLVNGTIYHYGIWVDRDGVLSPVARGSGVPSDPSTVVRYSSTPAGDYAQAASSYNIGFVFHLTSDKALLELGRVYKPGSAAGNRMGIWEDGTGTLLASVDVGPGAPTAQLAAPLVLTAGKRYVLGISEVAGSPWSNTRALTGLPSFLVVDDSAFNRNPTFSYPDLRNNQTAPIGVAEDWTMAFAAVGELPAPPDPVTGLQAVSGNLRVDLSWTNPASGLDSIRVVRKAGSPPADPSDGTLVFTGVGSSVADTAVANETTYHYAVWAIKNGQRSTVARASATPTAPPPASVTNLLAAPGDSQIELSWVNPTEPFDRVRIVRNADAPPADPADGTTIYTGVGTATVDTGLVNGTLHFYAVWVERNGKVSAATRTSATPVPAPLDPVENLRATPGDLRVDLDWTNPRTPFDLIKVVRKAGSDPADPADGTTIYSGTGTSVADTGRTNGTTYHYAVWAQRGSRLSVPTRSTATPVAPPLVGVADLAVTAADSRIDLSWTNPTIRFDRVVVVRKTGAPPADPTDGTTVYTGSGTSISDGGLSNGTTYHYALWVERDGERSAPARGSATPLDLSSKITYLAQPAGAYENTVAYNVGAVFHLTEDKVLLELGRLYGAGSTGTNEIAIWDEAAGTLLGSVTVSPGAPTADLPTPLILQSGKRYVLGIVTNGTTWSGARQLTGLPNFLVIDETAFNRNSSLSYPDQRSSQPGASLDDWTMTFAAVGAIPAPDPVSQLVASWNDERVGLAWTKPSTPFDLIKIVRKSGAAPTDPTDGTEVYSGTGTQLTDTGLTNGTEYHYAVWVLRGGKLSSATRVSSIPNVPVDGVTGLVAAPGDLRVDLSWTNPTSNFDRVLVVRKAGSAPADPQDGTTVYTGADTGFADTGLTNGTTYHYGVWVERDGLLTFVATRASATPVAPPLVTVTELTVVAGDRRIDLSWTNPSIRFDRVLVVRKAGAPPTSPADGTLLYSGTATSAADPGLVNGTTYHYAVWVDREGELSASAARASGTPVDPASRITYTAQPTGSYDVTIAYNAGAVFHLTDEKVLLELGRVYAAGSTSGNQIGIWDEATGTLLGSASVTPSSPVATLSQPIVLQADKRYVIGVSEVAGTRWSSSRVLTGLPGFLVIDDAAFNRNATLSYPDLRSDQPGASNEDWIMTFGGVGDVVSPDSVSGLGALAGDGRVDLSWTNPTTAFDRIRVVRKAGAAPADLDDGTTVYNGSGTLKADTGVVNGTTYHYAAWVERGGRFSAAQRVQATPLPQGVTNVQAVPGDLEVNVTWANPTAPFDEILVVRKAGDAPVDSADGTVVYRGTGGSVLDTGLANGTSYHYAVWASRAGLLSKAARANAIPVAPPLQPVTALQAVSGNARVDLTWVNPAGRLDRVLVVRKAGTAPADPADGTSVYSGTGTSVADIGVTNGTVYHYGVWVERDAALSSPNRVNALPVDPSSAFTYTAQPTGNYVGTDPNYNQGTVFHLTDTKALTKLGRVYKAGSTGGGQQIGIWDEATRELVVAKSVSPSNPVAILATPVVLQAGKRYVLGIDEVAGSSWSAGRVLTGLPGFLVIDDSAFNRNSGFSYPDLRGNTAGSSNDDWTATFAAVGTVTAAPVSNLQAVPAYGRVDLSWGNPSSPFDTVKVVRKAGSAPADPGDGTVIYNGTGSSVADTGLTNGITYHYSVWVVRGGALSTPARTSATPNPHPVTNLQASTTDLRVDLTWTNPTTSFDSIRVTRKVGGEPADPTDGTTIFNGTGSGVADSGLVSDTTYHYAVWVIRGTDRSSPARVIATPSLTAPGAVTNLQALAGDSKADLSWTNPSTTFDSITVVRKSGSPPADPADGTTIFNGVGASFSDTGLTNGTTYHYGVWTVRGSLLSSATRADATPVALVTYASSPIGTYTGSGAGYNLGAVFHVTQDKVLVKLGRNYKAGSTAGNQMGVWDEATRTLLVSVSVSPAAPVATLATPLSLLAGKRYVLGVVEVAGSPWSAARLLTGLPSFLVVDDAAYNRNSTFTYPDLRNNQAGFSNEDWTMSFSEPGPP